MLEDLLRKPRSLYYAMPQWQKRLIGGAYALLPDRIRLGGSFKDFVSLLRRTEYLDRQAIEELQFGLLQETIRVAFQHVPYYQKKFAEYGVTPASLTDLRDITKFPVLTKKDIQENYSSLIATNLPRWKHLEATTGGATSTPLRVVQLKGRTRSKERAFIWDGWSRVGYYPRARTVQFKGRAVGDPSRKVFWEYEPIQNFLEMDGSYLTKDNIRHFLREIRSFRPEFLLGYPSLIFLLALFLREEPKANPFTHLKAVLLTSEHVSPCQRDLLEEAFGCRIFSHYGHSEMVLLGMEGEKSHDLLFFPQYGYLEVLDGDTNVIAQDGASGELVGTSFHNEVMPLIRYRTQDFGSVTLHADADGRAYPALRSIEGRLQEYIVTRDRRLISIPMMGWAHFSFSAFVYGTQYYQEEAGRIEFHVVPREGYDAARRENIRSTLQNKLGDSVEVHVKEVPSLRRSCSGKHVMVIQKLPIADIIGQGYQSLGQHVLSSECV